MTTSRYAYIKERNPNPARDPGVFSLDELRFHLRRFWSDPKWTLTEIPGAKRAFWQRCGFRHATSFIDLFIADPPRAEYLTREKQHMTSRTVRQMLTGLLRFSRGRDGVVVAFVDIVPGARESAPAPIKREIRFKLEGARIVRLPAGVT